MTDTPNTAGNDVTRFPSRVNSDCREELAPGLRLGRYEVIRLLGRGGMGQVYLVRHELQKTVHALKILPSEYSARFGFVDRFRVELQTMARLSHPNIVHVTHSDEEDGRYYLVMDFIGADGTGEPYDLEEALADVGSLSPDAVRMLMLQLCAGLSYAHGQGVVHRDLKPANILLTAKDVSHANVKICDFGLARVIGEDQVRTLAVESMQRLLSMGDQGTFVDKKRRERSSTGAILGTYGYMSPEQEEGKQADARSDIYAMGVMMYRMITGQRLRGRAKAASQVIPDLDKAWDVVIDKCLEPDPAMRFQSVEELRLAVGCIRCGRQGTNRPGKKLWFLMLAGLGLFALSNLAFQVFRVKLSAANVGGMPHHAVLLPNNRMEEVPNTKRNETPSVMAQNDPVREDAGAVREKAGLIVQRVEALDAGQMFGSRLKELVGDWDRAEKAFSRRDWQTARSVYNAVLTNGEGLVRLDAMRQQVKMVKVGALAQQKRAEALDLMGVAKRMFADGSQACSKATRFFESADFEAASNEWSLAADSFFMACQSASAVQLAYGGATNACMKAERAKKEALAQKADRDAQSLFLAGEQASAWAKKAFDGSDFSGASNGWVEAVSQFCLAQRQAQTVQSKRKARADFENAFMKTDVALLEKYGGAKWQEVGQNVQKGKMSAEDSEEGCLAFVAALKGLPDAVAEAKKAERGDAADKACMAWIGKAQKQVQTIKQKATWLRGAQAEALIAESGAVQEEGCLLDRANLSAVRVGELQALVLEIDELKGTIRVANGPGDMATVGLGGGVKLELVWCPAGEFIMGSPSAEKGRDNNETQHKVVLTKGFWMGKYEVTRRQWELVMRASPEEFEGSDLPIESVSWDESQAFVNKLNELVRKACAKRGLGSEAQEGSFRLPTEAEWEYACRAGSAGPYAEDSLDAMAWFSDNSGKTAHLVGRRRANAWGLYDMHGNVWEWCQDWYEAYSESKVVDPQGPSSGGCRVFRGGSYGFDATCCRSAFRGRTTQSYRNFLGLRVVWDGLTVR